MKLRNIPLELDIFCEGEEAERVLKIHESTERTSDASTSGDEPSSSSESPDNKSP
jgi:hypothetical protein